MKPIKISRASLTAIKPGNKPINVWDVSVVGFGARIAPDGRISWVARYRLPGVRQQRLVTIGKGDTLSPEAARKLAMEHIASGHQGVDLKRQVIATAKAGEAKRKALADRMTCSEAVERYMDWYDTTPSRVTGRLPAPSTRMATVNWLRTFKELGDLPLEEVRPADITKAVDACAAGIQRGAYGAIARLFTWAEQRGYVSIIPTTKVDRPAAPASRDRTPKPKEMKALLDAADRLLASGRLSQVHRDFVHLAAFTAQRRAEVANMDWAHIDWDASEWVQPSEANKTRRLHHVPLSEPAMTVLKTRWGAAGKPKEGLVLPSEVTGGSIRSGLSGIMDRVRDEAGVDMNLHDIRRAAVSAMAEAGVDFATADAILNHAASASRGGTMGVYQRSSLSSQKKNAMALWARLVLGQDAKVLPMVLKAVS